MSLDAHRLTCPVPGCGGSMVDTTDGNGRALMYCGECARRVESVKLLRQAQGRSATAAIAALRAQVRDLEQQLRATTDHDALRQRILTDPTILHDAALFALVQARTWTQQDAAKALHCAPSLLGTAPGVATLRVARTMLVGKQSATAWNTARFLTPPHAHGPHPGTGRAPRRRASFPKGQMWDALPGRREDAKCARELAEACGRTVNQTEVWLSGHRTRPGFHWEQRPGPKGRAVRYYWFDMREAIGMTDPTPAAAPAPRVARSA